MLQFINKKKQRNLLLTPGLETQNYVLPFGSESYTLLQALAGQAGVAIENATLYNDIKRLFEGFVHASVMAIEQRDPTTSGHSFRVADLSVALANAVNDSDCAEYIPMRLSPLQIRELRYAALLHDFGKVGVRESVLVKAKKLSTANLENIRYRILIAKEKVHNAALREQIRMMQNQTLTQVSLSLLNANLTLEIEKLVSFFTAICAANEPSVLEEKSLEDLSMLANYSPPFGHEEDFVVFNSEESKLLSIRKGSLSPDERLEIQFHVAHTRAFLNLIPWTEELKNIPEIAGSHHEKLNGSGYPSGIKGDRIPLASKIMTICDIYVSLTSSDRPYKMAVTTEKALEVLRGEAASGAIDTGLLELFMAKEVYKIIEGRGDTEDHGNSLNFSHHVCDFDLHNAH